MKRSNWLLAGATTLLLLCVVGGASTAQAGAQPSAGVLYYQTDQSISSVRAELRTANGNLANLASQSTALLARILVEQNLGSQFALIQQGYQMLAQYRTLLQSKVQLETELEQLQVTKGWHEEVARRAEAQEQQLIQAGASEDVQAPADLVKFDSIEATAKQYGTTAADFESVAGVLTIPKVGGGVIKLESLGNGDGYGSTNDTKYRNQCTKLISAYAEALEFSDKEDRTTAVGHGHAAAKEFAGLSNGQFTYVNGNGGEEAPTKGTVLSISPYEGNQYGHVGIVSAIKRSPDGQSMTVTLFDQNWPSGAWRQITLTRDANGWKGQLEIYPPSRDTPIYAQIEGWANPNR